MNDGAKALYGALIGAYRPSGGGGGGGTTGTFTVYAYGEEFGYNFEIGMTWLEFIESEYSQDMFSDMDDRVYYDGGNLQDGEGGNIPSDNPIEDGAAYYRDES